MSRPAPALPGDELLALAREFLAAVGPARAAGAPLEPSAFAAWPARLWPGDPAAQVAAQDAARAGLADPYLPWTRLWEVLALGHRGNPLHPRPRDTQGPRLVRDLAAYLTLFRRLRADLTGPLALPARGLAFGELAPDEGGWCDFCGRCCCHAGTVPTPPPGVRYPGWWYAALAGETLFPQPFCPFLLQTRDRPAYFCAIHPVKPVACRSFGPRLCATGLAERWQVR
ncbi:MAG: hypothetical protein KQJ78_17290 [Deltaproteobacteria bacterium]|nr:hypothetical protein [Deltaproteobacteria bacterium]